MGYWGLGLELIFFFGGVRCNSAHNTVLLELIYYRSSPSEDEHRRHREVERPPQDLQVVNHKSRADSRWHTVLPAWGFLGRWSFVSNACIILPSPCGNSMGRYYCSHFTDKENELQKDWSHSILRRRSRTEPKQVDFTLRLRLQPWGGELDTRMEPEINTTSYRQVLSPKLPRRGQSP